MGEADPLVLLIIRGLVIYGVIALTAAAGFQFYRRETKSALILSCMAAVLSILVVVGIVLHGKH